MGTIHKLDIEWDTYKPSAAMQQAVAYLNQRTVDEILNEIPAAKVYMGREVMFDYRIYSQHDLSKVKKVYILINGFAERAGLPDSGIKNLLTDLLLQQTESQPYAILVIGGLFSFPTRIRNRLLREGSGALAIIAEGVANLLEAKFGHEQHVTVSGYSLGGVLAPLVAQAIDERGIAIIDQVCCGEPSYVAISSTRRELLKRFSHGTAYRNEQISATAIEAYIAIKKAPETKLAMLGYRAKQYQPLVRRALSMRLIVQDLALQAHSYPPASHHIQVQAALSSLAKKGLQINLLHAEFSPLCDKEPFTQLVDSLLDSATSKLSVITIKGQKADHGIEEYRTLSAPFLVRPDLYWPSTS